MKMMAVSLGAIATLLCLALGLGNGLPLNDCPVGWRNYTEHTHTPVFKFHDDTCYLFFPGLWTFYNLAQKECEDYGGTLAVITSKESNEFIRCQMKENWLVSEPHWIGLAHRTDNSSDRPYSNWEQGHEGYDLELPDHICPTISPDTGKWLGHICKTFYDSKSRPFVCQFGPIAPPKEQKSDVCIPEKYPVKDIHTTPVTTTEMPTTQEPTTTTRPPATTPAPTTPPTWTPEPTCAPFVCTLECGMDGYSIDDVGCSICQCD